MKWTSLKRTVGPGGDVVTVAEAKADIRMIHADDDTLLASLVEGATGWVEKACNRALAEQTWAMTLCGFPSCGVIRLPVAEVLSVVVTYRDAADAVQTLNAASYIVTSDEFGGELTLADASSWPATATRPDAVTVTMVAGYAKDASDYGANVPEALKTAIKMRVKIDYGDYAPGEIESAERAIETLMGPYKVLQR